MKMRNNSTTQKSIARKVVNLINTQGATWCSLEKTFGRSRKTLQRYLKDHYGLPDNIPAKELKGSLKHNRTVYVHLLEKAVANEAAEAEAKKLVKVDDKSSNEVIVTETGYLMCCIRNNSLDSLLEKAVFIPRFCFTELQNLSRRCSDADKALDFIKKNDGNITFIQLTKEQENILLVSEPSAMMKPRVKGIVALCSEMFFNGLKVHLLTTSKDVEQLALDQGFGDELKITYALLKNS